MKKLVRCCSVGLFLGICLSSPAQGLRLETAWSLTTGERPYLTTGTNQRGLAYNPVTGHLILVSRFGGINVYVIDAQTGNDIGQMDTMGIVGPNNGTFLLSKVGVADDGVIYAANFGTIGEATPAFKVYRWDDESSIPTVAYGADPGAGFSPAQQWGTTFDVRGAGTNTQILVTSSTLTSGTIAALLTTEDGTNFTSTILQADVTTGAMSIAAAFGAGNTFWAKSVNGALLHLGFDLETGTATTLQSYSITNFPGTIGPLDVDADNGLLAGINITTPDTVNLYSVSDLPSGPELLCSTNFPGFDFANDLYMGAVDFGGGRVFALDSNNGLAAYDIVPSNDPVPPSMVLQPVSRSTFVGLSAGLVASAAGTEPLSYQWTYFGTPIANATNATLVLTNVQGSDEGFYNVTVSNVSGVVVTSSDAYLTVLPPGIMTPLWSLAPGSRSYLTATGNNQRGMSYNPMTRHLILVNRAGGLSVNVLDAVTGTNVGTMSVAGVSGGTFALNMVGVADDGVIYAANFGSYPTTTPTVYRWANESATPTIAFQGDPANGAGNRQWGNAMAVRGAGTNTQILLTTGSGQEFAAILTTENGTDFTSSLITVPVNSALEGAAFGAGNTYWGKSSVGGILYHLAFDLETGTSEVLHSFDAGLFEPTVYPIAVEPTYDLLAGISFSTEHHVTLYDIGKIGPDIGPAHRQWVKIATANANTLFRGALDFGDGMLFALDTNNGLSAFILPFLKVTRSGANVVVSWPAALAGFTLETRPDAGSGTWTPVTGVTVSGDHNTVTLPASGHSFFRLVK